LLDYWIGPSFFELGFCPQHVCRGTLYSLCLSGTSQRLRFSLQPYIRTVRLHSLQEIIRPTPVTKRMYLNRLYNSRIHRAASLPRIIILLIIETNEPRRYLPGFRRIQAPVAVDSKRSKG
jgi:hypothetical protein